MTGAVLRPVERVPPLSADLSATALFDALGRSRLVSPTPAVQCVGASGARINRIQEAEVDGVSGRLLDRRGG